MPFEPTPCHNEEPERFIEIARSFWVVERRRMVQLNAKKPRRVRRRITSLKLWPGPRMALRRARTAWSSQTRRSPRSFLVLVAHADERQRGGYRLERLDA